MLRRNGGRKEVIQNRGGWLAECLTMKWLCAITKGASKSKSSWQIHLRMNLDGGWLLSLRLLKSGAVHRRGLRFSSLSLGYINPAIVSSRVWWRRRRRFWKESSSFHVTSSVGFGGSCGKLGLKAVDKDRVSSTSEAGVCSIFNLSLPEIFINSSSLQVSQTHGARYSFQG
jgi:hypothetical protein